MSDRNLSAGENPSPEHNVGPELRRLFDVEKEELPPFFFETLQLARGVEEEVAGYQQLEERALRCFFARIGQDYDAWRRARQRRRRRRFVTRVCTAVLILAGLGLLLGGMFVLWPQSLEALRQPLIRWFSGRPTPVPPERITFYDDVADLQPYFTVPLPQRPPAGFWPAQIELNPLAPAGPRGTISYRREPGVETLDAPGDTVLLSIRSLSDESFPFPPRAVAEPIELAGQPAQWIRSGPTERWVVWAQGPYKWSLYSSTLTRGELLQIGEDFCRQIAGR